MREPVTIETDAGPLAVRPLAPETLEQLGKLFPRVGWIEEGGRRLLALLPIAGRRVLQGLRTGYGWYPPEERQMVEEMLGIERLWIIEATAGFRSRGFQGVLMPAAYLTRPAGVHSQLGEVLFMRTSGPLRHPANASPDRDSIAHYESTFGSGATDALMTFVVEICRARHEIGATKTVVSDLEPCPADWEGLQWSADIVLVHDRVVAIRPELVRDDPLLAALVRSGITEIEHTPSVILVQASDEAD